MFTKSIKHDKPNLHRMKNIPLFDILFIILAAVVLLLVNHFVDAQFISKYSFMFVLIAYYVGKRLGKAEMKMNKDQE